MKVFNRRNVLKGGLVGSMAAGFASFVGASHAAEPAAKAPAQNDKNTYDVIVLGAGPAGLVTAIAAKQAGAKKVVVFEKRDRPDGNAIFALGSVCGWGSRHQKEQGIKDTADDFYAMMMDVSKQMGDKALNRTYTDNISAGIDWLEKDIGVKFGKIRPMPYPRLGRTCRVDGEGLTGGAQLVKKLLAAAAKEGVEVKFEHKGIELLHDDKMRVTGVKIQTPAGQEEYFSKGGVAIATGGFSANPEMVDKYIGGWATRMVLRGSKSTTGENISLTLPLYAKCVNMDQFHAGPIHPTTRANPSNMVNFGICVTPQGKRYIDEGQTYVYVGQNTPKLIKENRAFIIIDSRVVDEPIVARRIKRYQKAKAEIYKADTIADLAKQMGVPVETLESTVKEFNAAVHNGTTDKLAVPTTLEKPYTIEKAPFYGFMFAGGMTATFGGPKINPKALIINTEGQPIPGLYGAGNAVGGIFYDNYLDGSQLTAAVIWGRIAAREALARAKAMRS